MRRRTTERARRGALAAAAAIALCAGAHAVEPDEQLGDPALEARAREISRILRCVVCQSENIDDSNAPLARDLRLLVRERLVAGDDDDAVVQYVVDRYGDYVLLKPRLTANTALLWAAPALFLTLAGIIGGAAWRRVGPSRSLARATPLSDEEEAELRRLMSE